LKADLDQLLDVWRRGPSKVTGASWILPPAAGKDVQVVGDDYPYKAVFNEPSRKKK
jgi:hypothetical protein